MQADKKKIQGDKYMEYGTEKLEEYFNMSIFDQKSMKKKRMCAYTEKT